MDFTALSSRFVFGFLLSFLFLYRDELDFDINGIFFSFLTSPNETQLVANQFHSSRCVILLQVLALTGFQESLPVDDSGGAVLLEMLYSSHRRQNRQTSRLTRSSWAQELFPIKKKEGKKRQPSYEWDSALRRILSRALLGSGAHERTERDGLSLSFSLSLSSQFESDDMKKKRRSSDRAAVARSGEIEPTIVRETEDW